MCLILILPLTEVSGKIEYKHYFKDVYGKDVYGCKLSKGNIDLLSLTTGISILITLTVSSLVFIYIRYKTKKDKEEAEIYIRRVEVLQRTFSATGHIQYHKNEVEIEKSSYQVLKYLIICYTIIRTPRKNASILSISRYQFKM